MPKGMRKYKHPGMYPDADPSPIDPQKLAMDRQYRELIRWLEVHGDRGWKEKLAAEMLAHGYQRVTLIKQFGFSAGCVANAVERRFQIEAIAKLKAAKEELPKPLSTGVKIKEGKCTHWVFRDGNLEQCGAATAKGRNVCSEHLQVQTPVHGQRWRSVA